MSWSFQPLLEAALSNASPSVSLNTPSDASSTSDTTPTFDFTGTDTEGNDIRYQVQIDTSNTFNDSPGTEALDQTNVTGATGIGFGDTGSGRDYMTQGFIPTVDTLTAVSFRVADKDGSADIGYLVWIDAANANSEPTGTVNVGIGGVTEITNADIVTGALTKYDLASPVTVTPGDRYCIVMVPWNTTTNTKVSSYHDIMSSVANPYVSGRRVHLDGSFATPTAPDSGNADILFEVYGYNKGALLDKVSGTDSGFANPDNGGDTDPFTSGENIQFTVQAGDALSIDTYYWRVRGLDPSGTNEWGAWSSTRSFSVGVSRRIFFVT